MPILRTASVISLFLASAAMAASPLSWELRGGQWQPITPVAASQPTPADDETLTRVEALIRQGRGTDARRLGVEWIKSHKESPLRDRCLFLLGEAFYEEDDRIKAFYYYDELMDEYPESRLFYPALQKQYEIADEFLSGYRRMFLVWRILTSEDEAIDMMFRIQQRSPGSPLAEQALLRTADYYYADAQYDLSADAYGMYARSYPRSPKVPRVRLRQAFSNYAQFRGLKFDPTPLIDARAQLMEIIALYPDLAKEENLRPIVQRIDETFARKLLVAGDWYRRTNQPKGAAYLLKYVIATWPNSPEAEEAKQQLTRLPTDALNGPSPRPGNGYGPTTNPTLSEAR